MSIHFTCPHCGATTDVADQYAGQSGPCAGCGKTITVPPLYGVNASLNGAPPKRGLGAGAMTLIILAVALPVLLVCGGILLALLLPAVQAAREAARRVQCSNNMKQIGVAIINYQQQYGCYPPAYIPDKDGKPMHSWRVLILPYMECNHLYSQYRFDEPWNSPHNSSLASQMPSIYSCPSDSEPGGTTTTYAMLVGPHAFTDGPTGRLMSDLKNGTSNTIMVAEASGENIHWMEPKDINTEQMVFSINHHNASDFRMIQEGISTGISSPHPSGANVVFCDGAVQFLNSSMSMEELRKKIIIDEGAEGMQPFQF